MNTDCSEDRCMHMNPPLLINEHLLINEPSCVLLALSVKRRYPVFLIGIFKVYVKTMHVNLQKDIYGS